MYPPWTDVSLLTELPEIHCAWLLSERLGDEGEGKEGSVRENEKGKKRVVLNERESQRADF